MADHLPAPLVCLDCEARLQYGDARIRFHGFVGQHMCGEAQAGHVGQVVPRSVAERLEQSKLDARREARAEESARIADRIRSYVFGDEDDLTLSEGGSDSEILERIARHAVGAGAENLERARRGYQFRLAEGPGRCDSCVHLRTHVSPAWCAKTLIYVANPATSACELHSAREVAQRPELEGGEVGA